MRTVLLLCVLSVLVLMTGCPKPQAPETGGVVTEQPMPDPEEVAEPDSDAPSEGPSIGQDIPECPASAFGDPDSDVALQAYADLDTDGTAECIIGFQARTRDEVGDPVAPAYVELAKWNGSEWTGWFGVPAPDGETFVDEDSLVIAEDINEDGIVELGIQFYHFGVSSRRENLYLWQVMDEGLEPAVEGAVIDSTSDDAVVVQDVNLSFPGAEIVVGRALMGDEAHAAPHRYEISVYAWSSGAYRVVDTSVTEGTFSEPLAAIQSVTE